MKYPIVSITGIFGSIIAGLFGGWSSAMTTLGIFMVIDLITGFMLALVFHNSPKTEKGTLESKTMFKGLCRKGLILLLLVVAHRLDLIIGADYVQTGVCIAFIVNETISILENIGLMGVPVPKVLKDVIEILNKKKEVDEDE